MPSLHILRSFPGLRFSALLTTVVLALSISNAKAQLLPAHVTLELETKVDRSHPDYDPDIQIPDRLLLSFSSIHSKEQREAQLREHVELAISENETITLLTRGTQESLEEAKSIKRELEALGAKSEIKILDDSLLENLELPPEISPPEKRGFSKYWEKPTGRHLVAGVIAGAVKSTLLTTLYFNVGVPLWASVTLGVSDLFFASFRSHILLQSFDNFFSNRTGGGDHEEAKNPKWLEFTGRYSFAFSVNAAFRHLYTIAGTVDTGQGIAYPLSTAMGWSQVVGNTSIVAGLGSLFGITRRHYLDKNSSLWWSFFTYLTFTIPASFDLQGKGGPTLFDLGFYQFNVATMSLTAMALGATLFIRFFPEKAKWVADVFGERPYQFALSMIYKIRPAKPIAGSQCRSFFTPSMIAGF